MEKVICSVPGCGKAVKRAGLCYGHYMKRWRYGTPTPPRPPKWIDIAGHRFGTLVAVERIGGAWLCRCDCGETRLARAGDLNRAGDANTCGVDGRHLADSVRYTSAHDRVRRKYGKSSDHACVECGGPASHWAYDHNDPDELLADGYSANPIPYSLKPDHYRPMCVPCHKAFDLSHG